MWAWDHSAHHRLDMAGCPKCDVRMGKAGEAVRATSHAAQPASSHSPHHTLRTAIRLPFCPSHTFHTGAEEQEQQDTGLHQEKKREASCSALRARTPTAPSRRHKSWLCASMQTARPEGQGCDQGGEKQQGFRGRSGQRSTHLKLRIFLHL